MECGVPFASVKRWLKLSQFVQALETATDRRLQRIEDLLLDGEREAVGTLVAALTAMTTAKSGKKLLYVPDWPTRRAAADSLLNRRGERGKPVERLQQATFSLDSADLGEQLARALAEPTIRAMLEEDAGMAARLREELKQLAIGPVEENGKGLPAGEPVDRAGFPGCA